MSARPRGGPRGGALENPTPNREMLTKPWLAHYDEGVPPSLAPYPRRTLLSYISDTAAARPGHPAAIFHGARLAYSDLEQQSDALAAALVDLGVTEGDRVALVLPNCPQFLVAELGIWKARGVVFPLNPLYSERELQSALADAGVKTAAVEPARPVHDLPGAQRGASDHAETARPLAAGSAVVLPARGGAEGASRPRRPCHHVDERRDDRHAQGGRRAASLAADGGPAAAHVGEVRLPRLGRRDHAPAPVRLSAIPYERTRATHD
jgi:hypothetical protein